MPGSNTSTLSNYTEKDSASSIASEDNQQMTNEYDIVKKVLYGNRENVNIIHEIFRQVHYKVLIDFIFMLLMEHELIHSPTPESYERK